MSGVWGWFGGGAAQKRKDSPKNAILGLRAQLEMLQKRSDYVQNQIEKEETKAKEVVSTNKALAKQCLIKKKTHEKTLENTHAQIQTLEQQIASIESANINMETLQAMQKAQQAMKYIHKDLTPEKVDDVMDKLNEQNQLSNEIQTALTSSTLNNDIDEEELEGELEDLQQEKLDEQMLKTQTVPTTDEVHRLPSVGAKEPTRRVAEEEDEEAELRKLQAEMAM